jgi:glycosyltransferase involved in cell wall biosynthesis
MDADARRWFLGALVSWWLIRLSISNVKSVGVRPEITVVYPAFNEESALRATIERSLEVLRGRFKNFEVLLIDDCSRDRTGAIADELARANPELRVMHNPRNLGQGKTVRLGFQEARGELIVHNAIDYPFDLRDLNKLLPLLSDADVVVATRRERAGYSSYRTFLSVVNVRLVNLLFPLKLSDYNFVQLYRREVLRRVKVKAKSTAFLTPETLIRAHDLGFRVRAVEVDYHPRTSGRATSGRLRVVLSSLRDLFSFWLERTRK